MDDHPFYILLLSLFYPFLILLLSFFYPFPILLLPFFYPFPILFLSVSYPFAILSRFSALDLIHIISSFKDLGYLEVGTRRPIKKVKKVLQLKGTRLIKNIVWLFLLCDSTFFVNRSFFQRHKFFTSKCP